MKHTTDIQPEETREKRSSKGFYVALAVCVVAVAGVALAMFTNNAQTPPIDSGNPTVTTVKTTTTTAKPVAGPATGVPDTRTTTAVTTTKKTTTTTAKSNLFILPASNVILREYSDQLVQSETLGEWRTHNGVDFETEEGATVKASADGTVSKLENDPLWGDVIVIDHGDKLMSRYCGVTPVGINEGQTIKAGDIIGSVSSIPAEILDKPHLHLEITANGKYLDPMTLIRTN